MSHRSAAVASRAIELALRKREVHVRDLQREVSDPPSRQTIYRVLRELEGDDWIEQRGNGWVPGMKATLLGDVEASTSKSGGVDEWLG